MDVYILDNVYIHTTIFISNFTREKKLEILYSFIQTYFRPNENPYGRSLSLRRHTYINSYDVNTPCVGVKNDVFGDYFYIYSMLLYL